MKKTVEIEYVGTMDLHEILEDAIELMDEGHYVSIDVANVVEKAVVTVYIIVGGFNDEKPYDYKYTFYLGEAERDVEVMTECKNTLKRLMVEGE